MDNNVSDSHPGIDLEKIRIVRNCLGNRFHNVKIGGDFLTLFAFDNGTHTWQLKCHRDFLYDMSPIGNLRLFMDNTVIPVVLANPDSRIEVSPNGALTIAEQSS